MATVTLPRGCTGLDFADGTRVSAGREGSTVEVSSRNTKFLQNSWYGQTGVISGTGFSFGTKGTRRCIPCKRDWNAWSLECPRCGRPTEADEAAT